MHRHCDSKVVLALTGCQVVPRQELQMYVSRTSLWILSVALALGSLNRAASSVQYTVRSFGECRATRLVRRKERDADVTVCDRFLGGYFHGTVAYGSRIWDLDVQGAYLDIPIPDNY